MLRYSGLRMSDGCLRDSRSITATHGSMATLWTRWFLSGRYCYVSAGNLTGRSQDFLRLVGADFRCKIDEQNRGWLSTARPRPLYVEHCRCVHSIKLDTFDVIGSDRLTLRPFWVRLSSIGTGPFV